MGNSTSIPRPRLVVVGRGFRASDRHLGIADRPGDTTAAFFSIAGRYDTVIIGVDLGRLDPPLLFCSQPIVDPHTIQRN